MLLVKFTACVIHEQVPTTNVLGVIIWILCGFWMYKFWLSDQIKITGIGTFLRDRTGP